MEWIYEGHKAAMRSAVERTQAANKTGHISREYAATLYLLTGMEWTWPRLEKHTGAHFIDCHGMLDEGLSRGEEHIVALAGNLFNGGTYAKFEPIDLVDHLDNDMYRLAVNGLRLRRSDLEAEDIRE